MQGQRQDDAIPTMLERTGRQGAPLGMLAGAAANEKDRLWDAAEDRSRTVLVVEDESVVAMMIGEALEQGGYRVCGTASTEAEALHLAAEGQPAFAVVDIRLNGDSSGLNVGRALTRRGVKVLYASAYGLGFRQEMEDTGGRACLQKPFEPNDVPSALAVLEELSRGETPRDIPPSFHLFVD